MNKENVTMRTSVSIEDVENIFTLHGARFSVSDIVEITNQCNEQADTVYCDTWGKPVLPRTACEWAKFFARQICEEQNARW